MVKGHKTLSSHLQNILGPDYWAIKSNQIPVILIGGRGIWINIKKNDCAGKIMNFTFQQQLLDEISMKQIHWLSSFQRTFEAQLDPPIGFEWQKRLYIHFGQVQKLFTCFIAFWVSNGSEVIYHCLQSYIQVKMDGVIVYPKPEKRKGWHTMH